MNDNLIRNNNVQQTNATVDYILASNEEKHECMETRVNTTIPRSTNGRERSNRRPYSPEEIRFFKQDIPDGLSAADILALYIEKFGPGRTVSAIWNVMRKCNPIYFNKKKDSTNSTNSSTCLSVTQDDASLETDKVLPDTTQSVHGDEDSQLDKGNEYNHGRVKRRKTTKGYEYSSGKMYSEEEARFVDNFLLDKDVKTGYNLFTEKFGTERNKNAVGKYVHRRRELSKKGVESKIHTCLPIVTQNNISAQSIQHDRPSRVAMRGLAASVQRLADALLTCGQTDLALEEAKKL